VFLVDLSLRSCEFSPAARDFLIYLEAGCKISSFVLDDLHVPTEHRQSNNSFTSGRPLGVPLLAKLEYQRDKERARERGHARLQPIELNSDRNFDLCFRPRHKKTIHDIR